MINAVLDLRRTKEENAMESGKSPSNQTSPDRRAGTRYGREADIDKLGDVLLN